MKRTSAQNMSSTLLCLVVSTFMYLCCSCNRDQGRELVNAAGLSTNEVIRVLRSGADVNRRSRSIFGWTPLISAIRHHKEEVVDVLLAHGADVNLGDGINQTPLVSAIEIWPENTNLIWKLMQHGADPKVRNCYGCDAFEMARTESNSAEILEIIGQKVGK